MKFGIIGFGRMGRVYKEVLESLQIDIEFICDSVKQNVTEKFFLEYKDAIDNTNVDGIVISTYAPTHYEIINYAVKKNIKYIACEKPFTNSVKNADDILNLINNSKTRLNFNYIRRFSDFYFDLDKYIYHEDIIGNPETIIITSGAGGISTLGTHFIDLIRMILKDKVESIFAVEINHNYVNPRGKQFEDPGGYAVLNFKNKKRAFLEMSDDLGVQPKIEIIGNYGRIRIDELNNNIQVYARTLNDHEKKMQLYTLPNPIVKNSIFEFETIAELTKKMIMNLTSDNELYASVNLIRDNVEIYSGIRKGFETNNLVKLPLNEIYYNREYMVT